MILGIGFLLLIVLLLAGIPIAISIGFSALFLLLTGPVPVPNWTMVFGQVTASGVDSFVLIAAPFFMLAGELMNTGGMTKRIFRLAEAMVGWLTGGLGHVCIVASMIFAGMTGSAVSEAGGLGLIEIKALLDRGYKKNFAAAITSSASIIGPIIPPSIPMVIYASLVNESVKDLFLAGVFPGLLMALALMISVFFYAKSGACPAPSRFSFKELLLALKDGILPMLMPFIIIIGILKGIFSPTEASVVAVVYALLIAGVVYKELTVRTLLHAVKKTIIFTGSLFLIVAVTSLFGWAIARHGYLDNMNQWIMAMNPSPTGFVLVMIAIFLVIGCFMEPIGALILITPLILPTLRALDINLIYFGLVMVFSLMIGLLTPPVGLVLYIISKVADIKLQELIKSVLPYLGALLVVLLLVTFLPDLVLFLPNAFK
jgi:tripartite ATP-independent transporter DctM subunit